MQLATSTADPVRTQQFVQRLAAARDELAYVRRAPLDTAQRIDFALASLHGASASIHEALAGADALSPGLPGGVTSFPREAAALLHAAADEVTRATTGSPVDDGLVERSVQSAIGRLQQAIGLVTHPPTDVVYDGS
jgi:hypothetical protein